MQTQFQQHPPDPMTRSAVKQSPARPKKRLSAKNVLAASRRLRQRVAIGVGLCIGLTTLLIGFE